MSASAFGRWPREDEGMLCDECGHSEVRVFIRMEMEGQAREIRLCEECAARQGALDLPANLAALIHSLTGEAGGELEESPRPGSGPESVCPMCGLTSAEFHEAGRLGCEHCYEAHAEILDRVLRKTQGVSLRVNKEHRNYRPLVEVVDRLRGELAEAVRSERYDRAAALRDKIRALEQKLNTIGDASK